MLLNVFAHELQTLQRSLTPSDIHAVAAVHSACRGGYAVVRAAGTMALLAFAIPTVSVHW